MYRKCLKVVYLTICILFDLPIFANFQPPNPLKSPLYNQQSTLKGSYFPKSFHKLVLPETVFISHFLGIELYKVCQKVVHYAILAYFQPLNLAKSFYKTNEVQLIYLFPAFVLLNCTKSALKSYICSFKPILGPLTHSKALKELK